MRLFSATRRGGGACVARGEVPGRGGGVLNFLKPLCADGVVRVRCVCVLHYQCMPNLANGVVILSMSSTTAKRTPNPR